MMANNVHDDKIIWWNRPHSDLHTIQAHQLKHANNSGFVGRQCMHSWKEEMSYGGETWYIGKIYGQYES